MNLSPSFFKNVYLTLNIMCNIHVYGFGVCVHMCVHAFIMRIFVWCPENQTSYIIATLPIWTIPQFQDESCHWNLPAVARVSNVLEGTRLSCPMANGRGDPKIGYQPLARPLYIASGCAPKPHPICHFWSKQCLKKLNGADVFGCVGRSWDAKHHIVHKYAANMLSLQILIDITVNTGPYF